jgi:hypothetical protein
MAGGKTFKRDQKRRKEMARKLKQEEKIKDRAARKEQKQSIDDIDETLNPPEEPTDAD